MTTINRTVSRIRLGCALLAGVVTLGSCGWLPYHAGPDVYTGADNVFFHDLEGVNPKRTVRYSLDVGSSPKDVYIVFTNPSTSSIVPPDVEARSVLGPVPEADSPYASASARSFAAAELKSRPVALRDNPQIADWEPPALSTVAPRSLAPSEPNLAAVPNAGQYVDATSTTDANYTTWTNEATSYDFYYNSIEDPIPSVLAVRQPGVSTAYGAKTVEIWVQESEWAPDTSTSEWPITAGMAGALADAFLNLTADNHVYDWVSAVYGEEWSAEAASYSNTVDGHDTITILLYPIRIFPSDTGPGGVVGFFWSKDNFVRDPASPNYDRFSNERIMFYIDSETYGATLAGEGGWSIDNFWPNEIVSTLAHELQHMIHFHERAVIRDARTPVWMNEMLSLAAEDLVEEKRMRTGPRGVNPLDYPSGSAGPTGNNAGRLPLYNVANDISLTGWNTSGDVLESYSIAYSFGAYLGRNFGGARLFGAMTRSRSSLVDTVLSSSITAAGGPAGFTLKQLLWRWGAAVILSDTNRPAEFRYNPGSWLDSTAGGLHYRLGSVNLYTYANPPYYETGSIGATTMPAGSKLLYRVGSGLTGEVELNIDFDEGMDFAVVVK